MTAKDTALEAIKELHEKVPIWKRVRIGQPRYESPDELWEDAKKYFEWCDNNPLAAASNVTRYKKEESIGNKGKKKVKSGKTDVQLQNIGRPYTLYGLCAFAGIVKWSDFKRTYLSKAGFEEVIATIENIVASQQIDGALTGLFKENLASRLNHLAEKQEFELGGVENLNFNQINGFAFLPHTEGLVNSEMSKIASGEKPALPAAEIHEPEKEPVYAEIVSEIPAQKTFDSDIPFE